MRLIGTALVVLCVVLISTVPAVGQSTGDYRSNGTGGGNWSSAGTWETFTGSSWVAAGSPPTGAGLITIQATDSVSFDVSVSITGTLMNTGKFGGAGNLTVAAGGTYEHAENNGSLPVCTWDSGSTCLVTGYVSGSKPNNGNQGFYNLTWNCPGQTANVDLGMSGNTIRGNVTVISTGASNRMYLTSPSGYVYGNPITIDGNVVVTGGVFASNGSGTLDTIEVITHGSIIVTGGNFGLSRGSAPDVTWKLYGDLSVSNATLQNSGGTHVNKLMFLKNGVQKVTLSNVAYGTGSSAFTMEIDSGSTVDLDTSVISSSNSGSFILLPGATLATGHVNGIDGNIQCTGASNGGGNVLSAQANYEFKGSAAQVTGTLMPGTVNGLTVNNAAGVTLSQSCTVSTTLSLTAGILATGSGTLTAAGSVTRVGGYVEGNLSKMFSAAGSKDFELGTANGYSPVSVNVETGSGAFAAKAVQGTHPNAFDAAKSLKRYWTFQADPGITQAGLTFNYIASDVTGDESKYGAWRYTGTGTIWDSLKSSVNTTTHAVTADSVTVLSGDWTLAETSPVSSVRGQSLDEIPRAFFVDQNYPNPFNPSTLIRYGLPGDAFVTLKVYNVLGQEVATLVSGRQNAGTYLVQFDGSGLSSGVYIYRVQAGTSVDMKRMVMVK